jgi:ATP-binding cassette, subfamily C, bacterial CydCD
VKPMVPVGAAGRRALYLLGLAAAGKAAGLVLVASAVASGVAGLAAGPFSWHEVLLPGALGAVLRAVAAWGQNVAAQQAAAGVKEELRGLLAARILHDGGASSIGHGALSVLATRGLDNLDDYYTKYLPALVTCAVVPLLVGLRILGADWVSALIVVLTLPLVPVFMVLIGKHTEDRTEQAAAALDRLSDHLLELARGLPVLVGLGRAAAQTRALRDVAGAYRERTMATLRVAFLSSLALELIATISVAVVAVFVGIRLVYGDMGLEAGLLALILAPECFQPLRDLGSAHHASEDGLEALKRSNSLLEAPSGRALVPVSAGAADGTGAGVGAGGGDGTGAGEVAPELRVAGLEVAYPGRGRVLEGLDFAAPAGQITALSGPSGGGKSTVLEILAGLRRDGAGISIKGEVFGHSRERMAWIPQHPVPSEATVAEEVALYAGLSGPAGHAAAQRALEQVNAVCLADADTGDLSPGELRRLAVARALARIEHVPGVDVLLADEPTAHVDEQSARAIESSLLRLRGRVTILLVAHDPATSALADHVVPVAPSSEGAAPDGASRSLAVQAGEPKASGRTADGAVHRGTAVFAARGTGSGLWRQTALLRPWSPRFLAALCFGLGAALFAVSLTGLSGWLIVYASEQPPILHLMTSIVGVRFFGIGRSVLRYQERLKLHDAVFDSTDRLRIRLWNGLLQRPTAWRRLARGGGALERLIGDVDELRDVAPRAVFAPLVGLLVAIASCIATALLVPAALGWQILLSVICVLLAPALTRWADRQAQATNVQVKARSLNAFTRLLAAAPDLAANNAAGPLLDRSLRLDREATAAVQRSAWAQGLGHGLTVLACSLGAVVIIGSAGATAPGAAAVVVLMQLALVEPFTAVNIAVQQWGAWRAAGARLLPGLGDVRIRDDQEQNEISVETLELRDASYRYPGAEQDAFTAVDLRVERGQWLAVTGPSGSGKSTLLGALLGFLPLTSGEYLVNGAASGAPRSAIAWMPQEAHLFNSTLRANLLLARPAGDAPSEELMLSVLAAVGLGGFLAGLRDGLDTRIGPGGHFLSGGQRQRLAVARALLADSDVVLLDEPTAHLDSEAADALLADLYPALAGKAVVMVTHDERYAAFCGHELRLSTGRYATALR